MTTVSDEEIEDMSYKARISQALSMFDAGKNLLKEGKASDCQTSLEDALRFLFDVDADSPKSAQDLKSGINDLMQQVRSNLRRNPTVRRLVDNKAIGFPGALACA